MEKARRPVVPVVIAIVTASLLGAGGWMFVRARGKTNQTALADGPKEVTVTSARAASYRPKRRYVATLEPWVRADVGPQLVSAFVDTVLVRPGAEVKRGQMLATLDCRNASAESRALAMQARSLDARQKAAANEAARVGSLLDGGFVSPNEAEQKLATSQSHAADLLATQARMQGAALEVNDCVLRAPFDGEISSRAIDPGAFVRPGAAILSVVDRSTVRVSADVPETDFGVVVPGTPVRIHVLSTGATLTATVARRSPAASAATRTVHFEADLPDSGRTIPVGTTADVEVEVGEPEPATELPLAAAQVRGSKATVFVVLGDHVKKEVVTVMGETAGVLFVEPTLGAGTLVVTQGRSLLADGDRVDAKPELSAREGRP